MDAKLMKQSHAEQCEAWEQLGAVNRAAYLRKASDALANLTEDAKKASKLFDYLLSQSPRLDEVTRLKGATGESNDLYLTARGKALVVGSDNAAIIPVLGQLVAALLAGNEVILNYPSQNELCKKAMSILRDSGILPELIDVAVYAELNTLLNIDSLAVVAAVGNMDDMMSISSTLAQTEGILTQLIAVTDIAGCREMFEPEYLQRFCTEAVKTINTTAIGGNASLIELGAD